MGMTLWDHQARLGRAIARRAADRAWTRADWEADRPTLFRQFMRSAGLDPLPTRCDLRLTAYGEFRGGGYRARRLAWQVLPDCWATGVLYLPDPLPPQKLPGVLYTCGHGLIGAYYYQAHAMLWARRGYACLIFDTIEQHDNPGDHHGTWSGKRYDWLSLGYSGATGELWNSMRALDVLAGAPEADPARLGVTGVSGGGALSFFLAIADDRVAAAATVCGITVPEQTIRDRHVHNHCDCMYVHNLYGRDTSEFAALVAPRPLLFSFAERDSLFSLDEYQAVYERTQRVYRLLGVAERCALHIHPAGHGYHPDSHAAIKQWFDRHVAGRAMPESPVPEIEQEERTISIFNGHAPSPNHLDLLPELLAPRGAFDLPRTAEEWPSIREAAKDAVRREVLALLDASPDRLEMAEVRASRSGKRPYLRYRGELGGMEVWAEALLPEGEPSQIVVGVAGPEETAADVTGVLGDFGVEAAIVGLEPRGSGYTSTTKFIRHLVLRAGAITGFTPTLMAIQDIEQALAYLRTLPWAAGKPLYLYGRGDAGIACIYHALFDERVRGVVVEDIPPSHADGAYLLNVLRVCDVEHALGLLAPRRVGVVGPTFHGHRWCNRVYQRLGQAERFINVRHHLKPVLEKVLAAP